MLVQQINDVAKLFLGVDIFGPDGLEGDKVDDRGEIVVDPMVQLIQKGSLFRGGQTGQ